MGNYRQEAREGAAEIVDNYLDEIVDEIVNDGEASKDIRNDYANGDSYFHETFVDKDYNLVEAAELLSDLSDYKETDRGLWEGLEPERAIACQAAFTFGNAVESFFRDLVDEINTEVADTEETDRATITAHVERIAKEFAE